MKSKLNKIWHIIKENAWMLLLLILIIIATSKYIANGRPYIFQTEAQDGIIQLKDNSLISQNVIVNEQSKWNKESYSIKFKKNDDDIKGWLTFTLVQNSNILNRYRVNAEDITSDEFYPLNQFNYDLLKEGEATVSIQGNQLTQPIGVEITTNTYQIPNCFLDGNDTGNTLVQKYSYHTIDGEYYTRIAVYVVFIFSIFIAIIIILRGKEQIKICNRIQVLLIVCFFALNYIYDSSMFIQPMWAETVTNFLHNALTQKFSINLLISDAGYLPFLQRIIALLIVKILRISPYYAVLVMQLTAFAISGYILTFFIKYPFRKFTSLKIRFLLCLLMMIQLINSVTGSFINFIVYGIVLILFYLLSDSNEWSKKEYFFITAFSFLACISKGQYVIILPFMCLCLLLFYKRYSIRDKIFMIVCSIGAGIQLIYYFLSKTQLGINWVDVKQSSGQSDYIIKLISECLRDIASYFMLIFEKNITAFNGIAAIFTISLFVILIYLFIKKVILKIIKKQDISRNTIDLFMCLIFMIASVLFFRVTVLGVSTDDWRTFDFWNFNYRDISGRYEVFVYIPVILISFILIRILRDKTNKKIETVAVLILTICIMIGNSRIQLNGVGTNACSDARVYTNNLISERLLLKGLDKAVCRVIPIRPDMIEYGGTFGWSYMKNANVYYMGDNIFAWGKGTAEISAAEISSDIKLGDYPQIRKDRGIWQVFLARNNLINNEKFLLKAKNSKGEVIKLVEQDNSANQRLVSFTFDQPLYGVDEIQIVNEKGEQMAIDKGIYFVTKSDEKLLKVDMINAGKMDHPVSLLNSVIEQRFVARDDQLDAVLLRFGTYMRKNTGTITVEICDETGNIKANSKIDSKLLIDNELQTINFSNCNLKTGNIYTLRVYAEGFDVNNEVAVYFCKNTGSSEDVTVNGLSQDYTLDARVYGK